MLVRHVLQAKGHGAIHIHPEATVEEALHLFVPHNIGSLPVVDSWGRLVGIFTERDILLRVIDSGRNPAIVPLGDVMTRDPESLPFDARIAWALNMMAVGGYRHLPVTDAQGWPTAVLAVRDIVEFLVESFPVEVLNLPPDFGRKKGRARDGA